MSSLGDRMKGYENVWNDKLISRMPVIIRIDGKAFHNYASDFDEPFSERLHSAMVITAKYLCNNIQGCKLAYVQSDEISLLLTDYERFNTQGWFDYKQQKLTSVSASYATAKFNSLDLVKEVKHSDLAVFDSRTFNLTKKEVCNYFVWRQKDAVRNSIRNLGYSYFSHNDLQNKSNSDVQDMLMEKYNVNWNNLDIWKKRGSCVIKKKQLVKDFSTEEEFYRNRFVIDTNIPIFTKDRDYINSRVYIAKE